MKQEIDYLSPETRKVLAKECSIISIAISSKIENEKLVKTWQKDIESKFISWIEVPKD